MKTTELLKRYANGERDFRDANLRGQSFKGQDLSGCDFSGSDIRSANFTGAVLCGTNFSGAIAGLQKRWATGLVMVAWVLAGISGLSLMSSVHWGSYFIYDAWGSSNPSYAMRYVPGLLALFVLAVLLALMVRKGIFAAAVAVLSAEATIVAGRMMLALIDRGIHLKMAKVAFKFILTGTDIAASAALGAIVGTISIAFALAVAGKVAGTIAIAIEIAFTGVLTDTFIGAIVGIAAVVVAGAIVITDKGARPALGAAIASAIVVAAPVGIALRIVSTAGTGIFFTAVIFASAGAAILVSAYIARRALTGDPRDAWMRSVAIAFSTIGGTSFRNADLSHATFTQATLKSTDLRNAILTLTNWHQVKKRDRTRTRGNYPA